MKKSLINSNKLLEIIHPKKNEKQCPSNLFCLEAFARGVAGGGPSTQDKLIHQGQGSGSWSWWRSRDTIQAVFHITARETEAQTGTC